RPGCRRCARRASAHRLRGLARGRAGNPAPGQGGVRPRGGGSAREPRVPRAARPVSGPAFRLGLIGAGRMGRTHLRALAGSSAVAVTAVAEPVEAARSAIAGSGRKVFADVDQLLDAGNVDGVLITAPTDRHLDLVAQVLAAGLPILGETPAGDASHELSE